MRFSSAVITAAVTLLFFAAEAEDVVETEFPDETEIPTDAPTTLASTFNHDCAGCLGEDIPFCPLDAQCGLFSGLDYGCKANEDLVLDVADCSPTNNFFSDPMYTSNEWVFDMIKVRPVWEKGYFGAGIRIRVNDDGLDYNHPEFLGRFDFDASCDDVLPGDDLFEEEYSHGMAVASVMAASGDNGECAVGIAPETTLSLCKYEAFILEGRTAEMFNFKVDTFDISQNSIGDTGCRDNSEFRRYLQESGECPFTFTIPSLDIDNPCDVCDFNDISEECASAIDLHCAIFTGRGEEACLNFLEITLGGKCYFGGNIFPLSIPDAQIALANGIREGRDGKGAIYVFASGNEYTEGEDASQQWYMQNTRYTISVGAVGQDGLHAPYSTQGTAVLISAPGGSTLLSLNQQSAGNIGAGGVHTCADSGEGTSFATPVVSGVIALMLEANPDLTWRDVQAILALTGQRVDDDTDDSATVNVAGYWHSNQYGFGIINAEAAVEAAEGWTNVAPEGMVTEKLSGLNLPIPEDGADPLVTSISVADSNLIVETVHVYLSLEHSSRGHLEILLTSPNGMVSELLPGIHPENGQDDQWKFTTVRNWGEEADGEWNLAIVDKKEGDVEDCSDGDWSYSEALEDGSTIVINCRVMEALAWCANGQVDFTALEAFGIPAFLTEIESETGSGLTLVDACCVCGGGTPSSTFSDTLFEWTLEIFGASTAAETPEPTGTVPPTEGEPDCSSIEDILCGNESLSVLCDVLQFTTLPEITSSGLYTMFAPSNEAFDQAAIDFRQSDAFDASILLTHITYGTLFSDDLPCESTANILEMVNGDKTRVMCTDGAPTHIQGPANAVDAMPAFVETDIAACNGVVHIIGGLILQ